MPLPEHIKRVQRELRRRNRSLRDHMRIVMRSRGSPDKIALGVVISLMVGLTPLLGIHIPIALILATLFRASRLASIPGVFITNVFTAVPIYTFTYRIGHAFVGGPEQNIGAVVKALLRNLRRHEWYAFPDLLRELATVSGEAMGAMFVGGAIVGALISGPAWIITSRLCRRWRHRRAVRLNERRLQLHRLHAEESHASGPPAA
jgi:uncharacterized protein